MADFTRIKEQDVWINLDYVVRVELDVDEEDASRVTFADGSTFTVSRGDGKRLVKQFRPGKKKKKKKKTAAAPPAAGGGKPAPPGAA